MKAIVTIRVKLEDEVGYEICDLSVTERHDCGGNPQFLTPEVNRGFSEAEARILPLLELESRVIGK